MKKVLASLACLATLGLSAGAAAMAPPNITNEEMKLIPPYCPDTNTFGYGGAQYNSSPNAPKWVAIMGPTFWAMHHYCWALIHLSRIQRPSTPEMVKRNTRLEALGDLHFVLEHGERSSVVMPEVLTKVGEVQLALGNIREANEAYSEARSLRRDYWPAYYQWADYLRRTGQKNEARKLTEEGLSYAPGNKSLSLLLTTLGGDPASVKARPATEPATN
jgi:tetratricopeptide (TPR) repeat protein